MATTYNYDNLFKVKSPTGFDIYNAGNQKKYSYEELLPEFQAGLNADFIKVQPGVTPLTPEALQTVQPFPLKASTPPPIYPVESLEPPEITATPQEEKEIKIGKELESLYGSLVGQSAFKSEQEEKFGVETARKNINDLSAQLTALKNESAAIPLKEEQKVLEDGTILKSGFNVDVAEKQRKIAIASLGLSSLMAASQGQLANAQAMADRAVAQKYDPIAEKISTLQANLKLIQSDPLSSIQEKNRAQKQLAIQEKKAQEVARQQKNETEVWNIATLAASNAASFAPAGQYNNVTSTLQLISKAKTKEEALEIAQLTGLLKEAPKSASSTDITEYNLAKAQGYKGTFQQWVDRPSQYKGTGSSGKTPKDKQEERDASFEKYVKDVVAKVYDGTFNREQAKAQIRTLYPEYNENVIYDMVPDNYLQ